MSKIKKEVAVIIPTYKAHKTIKRTLSSLANQFGVSYKVYVVVDGEPIGSYDYLLDIFNFIDIAILYKPDNSGPGMTRQYAIEHTKEPFITFVDADDILLNVNALVTMRANFEDKDIMIITPFYQEMEDGSFRLRESSCLTWMHGKMYRRSFIKKYKIHFNKDYSYSNEDAGFNSMVGLIADSVNERIKSLTKEAATYAQLKNPNSITNNNNREFSRSTINIEGFVYNKLHAFDYAVNKLHILDDGIREAAVRSMCHIYINYVGINQDVDGYEARVDELAKISLKEYAKIYVGLAQEKIEEIEKDLILSSGYSYLAYIQWKDKIANMLDMEEKEKK